MRSNNKKTSNNTIDSAPYRRRSKERLQNDANVSGFSFDYVPHNDRGIVWRKPGDRPRRSLVAIDCDRLPNPANEAMRQQRRLDKIKNDAHIIWFKWLIWLIETNDTQILLMSGRSGVHAATTAVSASFSSAFTVGGMPLDAGRTRLLHRHLIQRRRRFDANAVIVILGIASVFPF